jgi:helicase required for RNAi-mediated heterochromatin assembly 1
VDLSSALHSTKEDKYENVIILKDWPKEAQSNLDRTQLNALNRILTKQLAIIQGPPGTGKTFITTEALKILLANRHRNDPPIIIACQTNHAIDQLLNQIAPFEQEFIRLGGRSKDKGIVKQRTLYEVKKQKSENPLAGSLGPNARKRMNQLSGEIKTLLSPLAANKSPLCVKLLRGLELLTEQQATSLEAGAAMWVQSNLDNPNQSPFNIWLGKSLISVPPKQMPENYVFEYEEAELAVEEVREADAENVAQDDEEINKLRGEPIPVADNFTCRKPTGRMHASDIEQAQTALVSQDMWEIPQYARPAVYRYLQAEAKLRIRDALRERCREFNELAVERRTGIWEQHETLLKKQKIIGMTTTGFSKYRGLLAALQPRIVIIEEAAETLEAPVTATCVPSLQHLILVGDHKQLRPHCHVKAHEGKPYWLNLSLFERMYNNKLPVTTLGVQRRMIPEIRRLLYPIYKDKIKDHPSVSDPVHRANVPGMGGVNSLFFSHFWHEQTDDQMSKFNAREADMIVGFVEYLFYNGMETCDITVLTFYNGQRKRIHSELQKRSSMLGKFFDVRTVDSYQGEQNKVIILSLARSNEHGQMGFLSVDNRICVALSRAQRGLYIFGNATLLYGNPLSNMKGHKMWQDVIDIMLDKYEKNPNMVRQENRLQNEPIRVKHTAFLVSCTNHGNITEVRDEHGWDNLYGGCKKPCNGRLPCGHPCTITCHPFSHEVLICDAACGKTLSCGDICPGTCSEPCSCKICSKGRGKLTEVTDGSQTSAEKGAVKLTPRSSNSSNWNAFAENEPVRYASALSYPTSPLRSSPEKIVTTTKALVDIGLDENLVRLSLTDSKASSSSPKALQSVQAQCETGASRKKWKEAVSGGNKNDHERDWSRAGSLLD